MIFSRKLVDQYPMLKNWGAGCLFLTRVGAFMYVADENARWVPEVVCLKVSVREGM